MHATRNYQRNLSSFVAFRGRLLSLLLSLSPPPPPPSLPPPPLQTRSPTMECSSPPSSNGTLSPVVTSPHHGNQSHPGLHQNHQPTVQVVPKDSVHPPSPPGNTAVHYPAAHFKHISGDTPSFVYPGSVFLNQPMIQPMW